MSRLRQASIALTILPTSTLAVASGDMSGAYVAFFLVPAIAVASFLYALIKLRGIWPRRIGLGILSIPASVFVYSAVDLVVRHTFISDYPGRAVWPNVLGVAAAAVCVVYVVRALNRREDDRSMAEP